jgi:hypothetical protein
LTVGFRRENTTKQSSMNPKADSNPFAYFLDDQQEVLQVLKKAGIQFCACDIGGEKWPALLLPNNKILAISCDPEGNGPGAIHVFDRE